MMSQKAKAAVLFVLLLVAAGVYRYADSDANVGPTTGLDITRNYKPLAVENPELQHWKLDASRKTEYHGTGRDLFSETLPPPPPKPKPRLPDPVPQPVVDPTPPPPTLPANMKYYGYGVVPNGTAKRGFLTDGESVYIVGEGDTLLGRFRILHIGNASLDFEEISTQRRNSAPLDEQAAPNTQ
jgi:hypothetical protein